MSSDSEFLEAHKKLDQYPWIASIMYRDGYHCLGSIVADNFILTSASCASGVSASDLRVRTGSSELDSGGDLHEVERIHIHADYPRKESLNETLEQYNIALIELREHLKNAVSIKCHECGGSRVHLVALEPQYNSQENKFESRIVDPSGSVYYEEQCLQIYQNQFRLHKNQFCARLTSPRYLLCGHKYRGAPLIARNQIYGIFLGWPLQGCGMQPAVYTQVNMYCRWMKKIIHPFHDFLLIGAAILVVLLALIFLLCCCRVCFQMCRGGRRGFGGGDGADGRGYLFFFSK